MKRIKAKYGEQDDDERAMRAALLGTTVVPITGRDPRKFPQAVSVVIPLLGESDSER